MNFEFFCHVRSVFICMLFIEAADLLTEDTAGAAAFAYITGPAMVFSS